MTRHPDRRTGQGTVLAFDRPAGLMVLTLRYAVRGHLPRSPYPPLVVPVPTAAPDWLFRIGLTFTYSHPPGRVDAESFADPSYMADFAPLDYWWATADELEAMLGYTRGPNVARTAADVERGRAASRAARASVEARRPASYEPAPEEIAAATESLLPWFPEWVRVARDGASPNAVANSPPNA